MRMQVRRGGGHRCGMAVALLAMCVCLSGCVFGVNVLPTGETSGRTTSAADVPATDDSEAGETQADDTQAGAPTGEIWQWALGRNAWQDPELKRLASKLGRTTNTNISAYADGFGLTLDAQGVVIAVVLMNDEVALGMEGSDTSFSAYGGRLPAGLFWTDSYDTVIARYGAGQLVVGGNGTEYTYAYRATTGQRIDVTYLARHAAALRAAPLHSVTVSR